MKTLVLYYSRHGNTREWAERLAKDLGSESAAKSITEIGEGDWNSYERFVLGASIYAGSMVPKVKKFCEGYSAELRSKPLVLFSCSGATGEKGLEYLESNYPAPLLAHAEYRCALGGQIRFETLGFFEKFALKNFAKIKENVDSRDEEAYTKLLRHLQK